MPDIIHLLPDSVANQIAAGEVIQRPGSALKELIENSMDAGADDIQIILKEAGRALIRVVDNGSGMSEADARMAFERHATSKIATAQDLFALRSFGFRGEALASIAAIAQVEVLSKMSGNDIGTKILIEGSKFIEQSPASCPEGTSIAVKNLFFNVPARRNFLKSNNVELRHCIEEFQRVALTNPTVAFTLYHNDKPVIQLKKGNLKQRIVNLFGGNFDEKIVPVNAETTRIKISGFIGKPQYAKRTKGEQFFFVNGRFIRHPYLNHAVQNAFEDLIPEGSFPSYFIYFEVDPADIDVNIHPTKTEINFLDARLIYSFLRSAVKQAFGKFSITPTLDFNAEQSFTVRPLRPGDSVIPPTVKIDPSYSPFNTSAPDKDQKNKTTGWEQLFSPDRFPGVQQELDVQIPLTDNKEEPIAVSGEENGSATFIQVYNRYIVTPVKSGMMMIDQRRAHQRILYESLIEIFSGSKPGSQQLLFPETLHLSAADTALVTELQNDLQLLGFDILNAGNNCFMVNGAPSDLPQEMVIQTLEKTLEEFKNESGKTTTQRQIKLARAMAKSMAIRDKKKLAPEEMQTLANSLFACSAPENDLDGGKTLQIITVQQLAEMFK
ncbi:MAG: DNA mismatch repair endonuclease MutL [Bacteroidales bacterium]|nr:DNA mismatch repair endonuclease MutL [Bacteroidales bacterium]MDD3010897.1 DNA mismatch repair endonuclease MutL [Bacteroidales bacterium]